jgi:CheY-like chemotaxis protein
MVILYVDDDIDDLQIFQEAVKTVDENIVCLAASNGLEALSILDSGKVMPDVIFLDINMPLMNGKDCLAEIRANSKMAHVPVVMFTTSVDPEEIAACKKSGANDFINKPVTYLRLTEIIKAIINSTNSLLT